MTHAMVNPITKEQLKDLKFDHAEVLTENTERDERKKRLHLAMVLGNTYKNKVKLVFKSLTGVCSVDTTIWATTDKNVVLKGGLFIPVACILQVII